MPIFGCKIDELLRKDSINASSKRGPPALAALGNIALTCSTGTYKHLITKLCFWGRGSKLHLYFSLAAGGYGKDTQVTVTFLGPFSINTISTCTLLQMPRESRPWKPNP